MVIIGIIGIIGIVRVPKSKAGWNTEPSTWPAAPSAGRAGVASGQAFLVDLLHAEEW